MHRSVNVAPAEAVPPSSPTLPSPRPADSPLSPTAPPSAPFGGEIEDLVLAMRDLETGVSVDNRRHFLRTYQNCFVGKEAVGWLLRHGVATTREQAVDVGNWLMSFGVFYHVTREHPFEDKDLFYVFEPNWPPAPPAFPTIRRPSQVPGGMPPRVVIIGGGPGGATAAKLLQDSFTVILIDSKDFFENTPALPKVLVSPSLYANHTVPHSYYLTSGTFVRGYVISLTDHSVTLAQNNRIIEFDYCIIASGSYYSEPIKVRAEQLDSTSSAEHPIATVDRQTQLREVSQDIQNSQTVIVAGGGPVGVEIASEIISKWSDKHVILIHSGPQLLAQLPKCAGDQALKWLKRRKVEVRMNEKIVEFPSSTSGVFVTNKPAEIKADLLLKMVGILPNSQFMRPNLSHCLNERNQIRVNSTLQVDSHSTLFAIGDVSDRPDEKMAFFAEHQAHYIAHSLSLLADQLTPHPYVPPPFQMLVNFGPTSGVYVHKGCIIPLPDFALGKMKNAINKMVVHNISGCFPDSTAPGRCFTCNMANKFSS